MLKTLVAFAIALSSISAQEYQGVPPPLQIQYGKKFGDRSVNTVSDEEQIPNGAKVTAVAIHQDGDLVDGFAIYYGDKKNAHGPYKGQYSPVTLGNDEFVTGVTCVLDGSGLHYLEFRTNHPTKAPISAGAKPAQITEAMKEKAPDATFIKHQLGGFISGERDGKIVFLETIWVVNN